MPEHLATDVKGPQTPQEVEWAQPFPAHCVIAGWPVQSGMRLHSQVFENPPASEIHLAFGSVQLQKIWTIFDDFDDTALVVNAPLWKTRSWDS